MTEITVRVVDDASAPSPLEIEHIRFHEGAQKLLGLRSFEIAGLPREGQPTIFEAAIEIEDVATNGDQVERTYRWQIVEGNNGSRAVALWRRPDGAWSLVRRLETCARLLAISPSLTAT